MMMPDFERYNGEYEQNMHSMTIGQTPSRLPAIKARNSTLDKYDTNRSSQNRYQSSKSLTKTPIKVLKNYDQQFDAYEMKRHNPTFKNGSSGMQGIMSTGNLPSAYSPTRAEQLHSIEKKMRKVDHVIDGYYGNI